MMAEISPAITVIKIIINGLNSAIKTLRRVLTSNSGGVGFFRLNLLLKISTNYTKYKNNSLKALNRNQTKSRADLWKKETTPGKIYFYTSFPLGQCR